MKITLERKSGTFGFEAKDEAGHLLQTDSSLQNGGSDFGFRPMQLLLAALGGCSAIDMAGILQKQKQEITDFSIEIDGEREPDVTPSLWKKVNVTFQLSGAIDADKANRAADLSMQKYCSVAETLRRGGTEITWTTKVNAVV
jgi:putative redox protein